MLRSVTLNLLLYRLLQKSLEDNRWGFAYKEGGEIIRESSSYLGTTLNDSKIWGDLPYKVKTYFAQKIMGW